MNVTINTSRLYFKTERLTIRAFNTDDLDDIYDYTSNPKIAKMAGFDVHPSKRRTEIILHQYIKFNCALALVYKDKVIGSITFNRYPENYVPEFNRYWGLDIGYTLNEDYWGQGLMKEALIPVMDYLFNEEHLDFITSGHFIFNNQSKRVQEKCGFVHYKLLRHISSDGKENDAWLSILTKDNFDKINQGKLPDFILYSN